MAIKIKYEARLKKGIKRKPYGLNRVYKKGTVIYDCTEKVFEKLTADNIHNKTNLSICEGYGVYEYFDLEDIEFFRVETVTTTTDFSVNLKTK